MRNPKGLLVQFLDVSPEHEQVAVFEIGTEVGFFFFFFLQKVWVESEFPILNSDI